MAKMNVGELQVCDILQARSEITKQLLNRNKFSDETESEKMWKCIQQ